MARETEMVEEDGDIEIKKMPRAIRRHGPNSVRF
jgi:hypothetical protein